MRPRLPGIPVCRCARYPSTLCTPCGDSQLTTHCHRDTPSFPSPAVYLSASCILASEYHGRRLQEDVLRTHSQAMTNMWPYLRARRVEVEQRKRVYETSFLARIFHRCGLANPVARRLWTSPDCSKQLLVAVRCVALALSRSLCML